MALAHKLNYPLQPMQTINQTQLQQEQQTLAHFWHTHVIENTLDYKQWKVAVMKAIPENATKAVLLVNGRIECYRKYQEVVHTLFYAGYAVFSFDHLGQGKSSRLLANPQKGYIDSFENYINCIELVDKQWVCPSWQQEKVVLAHSMGSAISYLYLATREHDYSACALSAPMFGFLTTPYPSWLVKSLAKLGAYLGKSTDYFISQGDYKNIPFSENHISNCEERHQIFRELYLTNPNLQLGGVTYNWFVEAARAVAQLQKIKLAIPCLILQAEQEEVVCNDAQNTLAQRYHYQLKAYANAKHELLFEQDEVRDQVFNDIDTFFRAYLPDLDGS